MRLLAACCLSLLTAQGLAQDPVPVPMQASRDALVALAATVRPSPRQLAWQATGDLDRRMELHGFVYQPRDEGDNGTVAGYAFFVSTDGTAWREVASGTFANIASNPVAQTVRFAEPAKDVRFIRFVAKREVQGRAWASCGELSVLLR